MAVIRAPKKGVKAGKKVVSKSKPAKKKTVAKKLPAKKAAPVKIVVKQVLDAKDVAQIIKVKESITRQKEVLAELATRGVTNINRIAKSPSSNPRMYQTICVPRYKGFVLDDVYDEFMYL